MKRALLAAAMMAALVPASVRAEDTCDDREKIVAKLASEYKETAGSRGLTHAGTVLEIFTSRDEARRKLGNAAAAARAGRPDLLTDGV